MKDQTKAVGDILDGMIGVIRQDQIDFYKSLTDKVKLRKIDLPSDFSDAFIHPHEDFLKGLIRVEISKNEDVEFLLLNTEFIEQNFEKIIQQKEGSPCCADKSSMIVAALFNWFKSGKEIKWNYTSNYSFAMPKKVFIDHDSIIEFYNALKLLRYGVYKDYLMVLKKLITQSL